MNRRWVRVKPYCESLDFQQELKKKKRREEYLVFKMCTTLCILFISNAEYFVPLCFYFIGKFDRGKNMFSYTMICMGQLTIRVRCLQKSGNTPSYVRLLTPPPNKPWNLKLSVVLWIPNGFRTFFVGVKLEPKANQNNEKKTTRSRWESKFLPSPRAGRDWIRCWMVGRTGSYKSSNQRKTRTLNQSGWSKSAEKWKAILDLFGWSFKKLSNCAPTPPLTQH